MDDNSFASQQTDIYRSGENRQRNEAIQLARGLNDQSEKLLHVGSTEAHLLQPTFALRNGWPDLEMTDSSQ